MISLFSSLLLYVLLICSGFSYRFAAVISLQDDKNVSTRSSTNNFQNKDEKFTIRDNSQNRLIEKHSKGKFNEKIYYNQTFKPVKMPVRSQKIVISKKIIPGGSNCKTPNNDTGNCLPLADCSVLENVKNEERNREFLENSLCESGMNEMRYCCGKYENFKYLLPRRPLPKSCGYQQINLLKKGKIFGGTEAKLGEFPWLARIIHTSNEGDKSVGCEGFLIHKRFILTAAHCVKTPRIALVGNITEIQLGEHNTQTEKDCNGLKCADPLQTMKVKSIIPHPEYRHNSRNHHYDIALIYLKGEVKFSDYVQPICLLDKPNTPEQYLISGWGKTEKGNYSTVKMKLSIPPFDITECNKKYSKVHVQVGQSQFCAGGEEGKDSCVGDSGGPLMQQNEDGRWFAVGLVSFGISCGLEGWPGVYTSIPFYYDWIADEIIKLREPELLLNLNSFLQSDNVRNINF